jgi:lysophospholipase L1-like esterase
LHSLVTPDIVPIVEISSLEFSQLRPSLAQTQEAIEWATNLQALPKPQSAVFPTSGSQLYVQRLAALKAGKIYTRLPADSFYALWAKGGLSKSGTLEQPTHEQWLSLLEQEAKSVAQGQGANRLAILLGDSLSMWFPSGGLPSGQIWLNQGISGENSGQIRQRLWAFSETRPDTIYVMAGTNDLRQGISDRIILDNLRQIVRRLRLYHPQSQVIIQSILPTRLTAIGSERVRHLNQQIALIAQQEGIGYLNLHTLFADAQGQLRQDLTTDGIHLTRRGYQVWEEAINYADSSLVASRGGRGEQLGDRHHRSLF